MQSNFNQDQQEEHVCEIIKNKLYFMTIITKKNIKNTNENIYFCIDKELRYNNYYHDFGPLNIACLFKYCCKLTQYLENFSTKRVIHYTIADPNKRVNAACLIGSYCIIYLGFLPRDVLKILTYHVPSYRLFLDASQGGCSGYTICLNDVLSAVYKAHLFGFFNFQDFDAASYDHFNTLKNGDFNWLLPRKFLAFIGPIDNGTVLGLSPGVNCHPPSFYINYFLDNDVRTVIRLNNKLYDETVFTDVGIAHYDMYFSDGTIPTKEILLQFLHLAENTKGAIAVHCKAGLGRTGSLIAAYIIKHYRMTAREAIGWLRLCRPGSVIGQQQGWLEKIEKWLWRQGSTYRVEYFGQGDRIPHHRFGIYSLKWKEYFKRPFKLHAQHSQKPERKIISTLPREGAGHLNINPNPSILKVITIKPKVPLPTNKAHLNCNYHPIKFVRKQNSKSCFTNPPTTNRPENGNNGLICHQIDLNRNDDDPSTKINFQVNNRPKHGIMKMKMVSNKKSQDNTTIFYVNPKKAKDKKILISEVPIAEKPLNFLKDSNKNKVSNNNYAVNKPRATSAYADYNVTNNKNKQPRPEKKCCKSANLKQYETNQNTNMGVPSRRVSNNNEIRRRDLINKLREYRPVFHQDMQYYPTQGDRLNELKTKHNTQNQKDSSPMHHY